jgi:hypothetical protein
MSEACEVRHAALVEQVGRLEARVGDIDSRVRTQGESISALRAQVAMWAALGALAGGGIVSVAVNVLTQGN